MKPLKPRDKVTQRMTRDGLTLDNQTTGESVNAVSYTHLTLPTTPYV